MAKEFELEDKIAIPTLEAGLASKYPFDKMKVGQSFYASNMMGGRRASQQWSLGHRGIKFKTRAEGNGVRIWRIA